ncbi:hypothetical protein BGX34_007255 [Mortierella sp. NVP85]|nr:hypothetical protein BGX34_007255 [Mortierella sp. NVP85]
MFDSAQFEGADLRQVDLRGAWLRKVNLSKTQMSGVQFGELPYLKHDSHALEAGTCLWTLAGHNNDISKIVYSSQEDLVVSASDDRSVQVWDIRTGQCRAVIQDFQHGVQDFVWIETPGVFDVKDTEIHDVQGLSHLNKQLLYQQGAVGEPAHRLREASRKLTTMTSMISKMKALSLEIMEDSSRTGSGSAIEWEQKLQQAKNLIYEDMVAPIVKSIHGRE